MSHPFIHKGKFCWDKLSVAWVRDSNLWRMGERGFQKPHG